MSRKICGSLAVAVIAAVVLLQSGVYAEEAGNAAQNTAKKEAHFNKMSEELQLTPQQKEQLAKEKEEFGSRSKDLREKIQAARTGLKTELEKPAPDKAKVDGLVAEIKNMVGQQIQNRVDKVMAMKQILTPEQFNKMKASMKEHKQNKHEKHGDKSDPACTI
ncbi:MAG: periplasmic heavy metal sensor [Candidatus Omnitrophica bacterium]|nr:periplasmic heavy metal sensor [Candidatus Omnitrophota bacterium]